TRIAPRLMGCNLGLLEQAAYRRIGRTATRRQKQVGGPIRPLRPGLLSGADTDKFLCFFGREFSFADADLDTSVECQNTLGWPNVNVAGCARHDNEAKRVVT